MKKKTWCFEYWNVFNDHCYIWIEAQTLGGAEHIFREECDDFKELIVVRETETWR